MEVRRQTSEVRKNTFFIMYIIAIVIMAVIYFSMPERKSFFEYQKKWWSGMWEVVTDGREESGMKARRK